MDQTSLPTAGMLSPLRKATSSLANAVSQPYTEYTRDATIQRFEYTFELAWKMLQRHLKLLTTANPANVKDLFREAARLGLISTSEVWFEYLKARNLTSHTYNLATAEEAYAVAKKFLPDVQFLLLNLERLGDVGGQ